MSLCLFLFSTYVQAMVFFANTRKLCAHPRGWNQGLAAAEQATQTIRKSRLKVWLDSRNSWLSTTNRRRLQSKVLIFVFVIEIDLAGNKETIRLWFSEIKKTSDWIIFYHPEKRNIGMDIGHAVNKQFENKMWPQSFWSVCCLDWPGWPLLSSNLYWKTNYQGFYVIQILASLR